MTAFALLSVAVAGGVGTACRFVIDALVRRRLGAVLPWGTMFLNVSGSFLLGLVVGGVAARSVPADVMVVAASGFLGGYTTFSTAALDTVRLAQAGRVCAAAATAVGVLVAASFAAAFGWWAGVHLST